MMLNQNEAGKFWNLLSFVHTHIKGNYKLKLDDGRMLECKYFTSCESDNGLDLDDSNYEEYWIIVFENLAAHKLFEVNYHNTPTEVFFDGKKIELDKS